MSVLYTKTVSNIIFYHSAAPWRAGELTTLRRMVSNLKIVVKKTCVLHCSSGLFATMVHVSDHAEVTQRGLEAFR